MLNVTIFTVRLAQVNNVVMMWVATYYHLIREVAPTIKPIIKELIQPVSVAVGQLVSQWMRQQSVEVHRATLTLA